MGAASIIDLSGASPPLLPLEPRCLRPGVFLLPVAVAEHRYAVSIIFGPPGSGATALAHGRTRRRPAHRSNAASLASSRVPSFKASSSVGNESGDDTIGAPRYMMSHRKRPA
jgi:hypothetical protein